MPNVVASVGTRLTSCPVSSSMSQRSASAQKRARRSGSFASKHRATSRAVIRRLAQCLGRDRFGGRSRGQLLVRVAGVEVLGPELFTHVLPLLSGSLALSTVERVPHRSRDRATGRAHGADERPCPDQRRGGHDVACALDPTPGRRATPHSSVPRPWSPFADARLSRPRQRLTVFLSTILAVVIYLTVTKKDQELRPRRPRVTVARSPRRDRQRRTRPTTAAGLAQTPTGRR